jgi:hypothetical protein
VTSQTSLASIGQRTLTRRTDPRPTGNERRRKCGFALESAVAFDEKSVDGWCRHFHYDDPMAELLEDVRRLYRQFGSELSDLHARSIEVVLRHRPKGASRPAPLRPGGFGWTNPGLAVEFSDYTARYRLPSESPAER